MVRLLPQVLVYSNGAFGRPWAVPRTLGDLGETRIQRAWSRLFAWRECGIT